MIKTILRLLLPVLVFPVAAQSLLSDESTGPEVMQAVEHHFYYPRSVYEEISMILTDGMGNRDTYSLRKYLRVIDENNIKFLLLFDSPDEFRGVALLAEKKNGQNPDMTLYLPAYGEALKHATLWSRDEPLFGTDFTFRELSGVFAGKYRYVRRPDRRIQNIDYYIVDVFDEAASSLSTSALMQHYIRQDSGYITRTDYFDRYGRFMKQLTMHDLVKTKDNNWMASMMLMENRQKDHRTLIKVNKRVISEDYVPDEVFTINWLLENQPPLKIEPGDNELEIELMDAGNGISDKSIVNIQKGHR